MIAKQLLIAAAILCPASAFAQAADPAVVGQILTQRGTTEGYVDRAQARQRGERPRRAVLDQCMAAWRLHDRMTLAEKRKLYDLCPR